MKIKINNVPNYAAIKSYIVAREIDGELWFWGAWDSAENAKQAAQNINGLVIAAEEVE